MSATTFIEILKYNDKHDPKTGRFAPKNGGGAATGSFFRGDTSKFTQEQKDKYIELLNTDEKEAAKYRSEMKMSIGDSIAIKREAEVSGKLKAKEKPAAVEKPKEEKPKVQKPSNEDDYRMSHRPSAVGRGFDITEADVIPKDVYDHPEWYFNMRDKATKESMNAVKQMRNKPDAEVTIYRAAPKDEFNDGDWITLSPTYAKTHAESNSKGDLKLEVYSRKVKAKEIQFAGDDINEFGYFPNIANEKPVFKGISPLFSVIFKFNPYHDERGRFASKNGNSAVAAKDSRGNKLSEKQQSYFKDSKVRDENGNLLVVYHGTTAEFEEFKTDYRGAIWTTNEKNVAENFATQNDGHKSMELYANIKKPLEKEFSLSDNWDIDQTVREITDGGYDGAIINFKAADNSYLKFMAENCPDRPAEEFLSSVLGHGGTAKKGETIAEYVKRASVSSHKYIVALDSSQLKSVTNDAPTDDKNISKNANVLKFNPYHDERGRFTSGGGAGATAASSQWAQKMEKEKADILSQKTSEQALFLYESGMLDYDEAVDAMKNKTTEMHINNYFTIMTANGNPTSEKPLAGNKSTRNQDVDSGKYNNHEEAKKSYIKETTGMNDDEVSKVSKELDIWTSNSWGKADTSILDNYIEKDHTYDGEIFRGMSFTSDDYAAFMTNIEVGSTISMRRNSSWSSSEEDARTFSHASDDNANSVMIRCVKNRTASPIAYLNSQGEDEVIAHSKSKWTVLNVQTIERSTGAKKTWLTVIEKGAYDEL